MGCPAASGRPGIVVGGIKEGAASNAGRAAYHRLRQVDQISAPVKLQNRTWATAPALVCRLNCLREHL